MRNNSEIIPIKIFLQNIVKELKQFSLTLDKESLLINKPWKLVDSDLGIQKLFFSRNHELILSRDGKATIGRWDYSGEARCLLIDRGVDKILCNEAFIDKLPATDGTYNLINSENVIVKNGKITRITHYENTIVLIGILFFIAIFFLVLLLS